MLVQSRVVLAGVILGSWLIVLAHENQAGPTEIPALALEVTREGRSSYVHPPAAGAPSSFSWDAEVQPANGQWTAGLLSFQLASADSLRVQLFLAELASPIPDPTDFKWKPMAEYVLALKEGTTVAAPELAALRIQKIRLVSAQSLNPDPPEVIEKCESLKVSNIVESFRNTYSIELLNVSTRRIRGVFTRRYRYREPVEADHARGVVEPGETLNITLLTSAGEPKIRMEIVSVLFEDGACEGEPGGCARIQARRAGRLLAARLQLPILHGALENPDAQQVLDALSKIAADAETTNKLIERLVLQYPGSIDNDLDRIVDDFSRQVRIQGENLRQLLERFPEIPGSGNSVKLHIREQIRQCNQTIARDGWY